MRLGTHHSLETRKKIGEANKRRPPQSSETIERIRNTLKGRVFSEEHRANISAALMGNTCAPKGVPRSEETKARISAAKKGKPVPEERKARIRATLLARNPDNFYKDIMKLLPKVKVPKTVSLETRSKIGAANSIALKGKKLSEETCKKMSIARTGLKRTAEQCAKLSVLYKGKPHPNQRGSKHPNWKGGISYGKYCPKFNNPFKHGVRKFFDNRCMYPGCNYIWNEGDENLHVHHVYYNKGACCTKTEDDQYIHTLPEGEIVYVHGDPNKFITLCRSHHTTTNHRRLHHALLFEKIINDQFGGKSYYTHDELKDSNSK